MRYKITIDRENCISCGSCEEICPSSFHLDEKDNKSRVKKPVVNKLTCEEEAADRCPVKIIKIEKIE